MKRKNSKKAHNELVYAYYELLMKNEELERTVAMYKALYNALFEEVRALVPADKSTVNLADKA